VHISNFFITTECFGMFISSVHFPGEETSPLGVNGAADPDPPPPSAPSDVTIKT